jgi:hypothetical protein
MAPKRTELAQLQKIAEEAASLATATLGQPVQCIYKGQPYGPKSHPSYRLEPDSWRVKKGDWASQQDIVFEWTVGEATYFVRQTCKNSLVRGVLWSEAMHQMRKPGGMQLQKRLEKKAEEAALAATEALFGQPVQCVYKGQPYGPKSNPSYRLEPGTWQAKKDEWESQQDIVFEWTVSEATYLVRQTCKNSLARGVLWPEELQQLRKTREIDMAKRFEAAASEAATEAAKKKSTEWGLLVACKCLPPLDTRALLHTVRSNDTISFVWELDGYEFAGARVRVQVAARDILKTGVPSPHDWPDKLRAMLVSNRIIGPL